MMEKIKTLLTMIKSKDHRWNVIFTICLLPLLGLLIDIIFNNLGSNPIQALHIRLGDWSLRFLGITLAVTPIQTIMHWRGLADYRKLFGLYSFFYATLHILTYIIVDNNFMWGMIWTDILESPYIWFGVIAYIIVFLLGITTPNSIKKMLGKNWKKLHRFIYLAGIVGVIHYFWQLKGNLAEPLLYTLILFFLLGFRALVEFTRRRLSNMMMPKRME
ncbi:MAG: protein-methionine-sulfoxide reductase heme-binding subunit MsrQ [Methylococcales bacterium]